MDLKFLEFEQPIAELEAKIDELRYVGDDSEININEEVVRLKAKSEALTKSIYTKLSAWQIAQVARHPMRPYTADYLELIAPDFQELHGDRMYADDPAIIGGIGRLEDRPIMFIGHQKGRDTKERIRRNYGMPKPEGYRKAQRLMKMAEKYPNSQYFGLDIDTSGIKIGNENINSNNKNSLINKVIDGDNPEIISTHHQGIRNLGSGLKPVSWSDDGLIEAIEDTKIPDSFLAVQWHPEFMLDDADQIKLFKWLVLESLSKSQSTSP